MSAAILKKVININSFISHKNPLSRPNHISNLCEDTET